ncbi:hypothetical protein EMCRGX_G022306 [Ephydatia muelleri]|eukprot:Em0009g1060a
MAEDDEKKIKLTVKTPKDKVELLVSPDSTVKELKELLSTKVDNAPVASQCIIFAGKITKDDETLSEQGMKDGVTVHLVVRSKPPSSGASSPATTASANMGSATASSAPASSSPGAPQLPLFPPAGTPSASTGGPRTGLPMQGMFGGGDMQAQMQQLMNNPELLRQLMENPMMQSVMQDPDTIRSMLTSHPQIQQLMEQNPELSHLLDNPEMMRQAMELARNPAAFRELMRSQDRQLSNIESLPGGLNALARMYTEIQEPMMDAAQESLQQQLQGNPFASLLGGTQPQSAPSTGPVAPPGTTNTAPLPNPWAPTTAQSPRSSAGTTAPLAGTTGPRGAGGGTSTGGLGGLGAMFGGGGGGDFQSMMREYMQTMQSNPELLRQAQSQVAGSTGLMAQNPEMIAQLMQSPLYQQMMEEMMGNPELMQQMMSSHPLFAGNPNAPELARQAAQMMQQNDVRQMMTNPDALRAIMQIQQGMSQLQNTAPGLLRPPQQPARQDAGGVGVGSVGAGAGGISQQQVNLALQQLGVAIAGSSLGSGQSSQSAPQPQRTAGTPRTTAAAQGPAIFRAQLEQLEQMGFTDRQANIRALIDTAGDINAAVNRLLQ